MDENDEKQIRLEFVVRGDYQNPQTQKRMQLLLERFQEILDTEGVNVVASIVVNDSVTELEENNGQEKS